MAEILTTQQALDCNKSDTPYISMARLVRSHEALRARVTELENSHRHSRFTLLLEERDIAIQERDEARSKLENWSVRTGSYGPVELEGL